MDRAGVDGPQLRNRENALNTVFRLLLGPFALRLCALLRGGLFPRLLHALAFPLDHFGGAADFLTCRHGPRIDGVGLLELHQGVSELSLGAQLESLIDVRLGGQEVDLGLRHLVNNVRGVFGKRLGVGFQGFVPLLLLFVDPSLGQKLVAFLGPGFQRKHRTEQRGGQHDRC